VLGQQQKSPGDTSEVEREKSSTIALKSTVTVLIGIHDKLHGDLLYAKTEIAGGQLDAQDLDKIFVLFRSIMLPLAGLSMLPEYLIPYSGMGSNGPWL
jgi:hypothetical protein